MKSRTESIFNKVAHELINRKKAKKHGSGITVLYNNINGYASKKDSLNNILQVQKPDIVCLCETKLGEMETCNLVGYEGVANNYKRGKEGLAVAARIGAFLSVEKVSENLENIFCVRITYPELILRMIVCHGPQEDDESEIRRNFFDNLAVEIECSRVAGETPIVVGDMNAKISLENGGIVAESFNGKFFKEMVEVSEMNVANFHENAIGKWTRIQNSKKKGTVKSVLDYILTDDQMNSLITEVLIDEEKYSTPFRVTKSKKANKITYTDHCSMFMTLNCSTDTSSHLPVNRKFGTSLTKGMSGSKKQLPRK